MGYRKTEVYVCDWCGVEAEPVPDPGSEGRTRTSPLDWGSVEGGNLLCGQCSRARTSAINDARTRRSR